ncbi:MAG: hypothetical protein GOMPHAMPRED_005293 [Gomphillus americanus]|uniref:Uncharacterized protein n=1 Tax=Gomphillus americanus TaxID=1940652 RepID=A0A8H3IUX2_9LECA|nr:MAG: hypothetical protein GOMPHAMPRED_005293 [Gomphillus americanus]
MQFFTTVTLLLTVAASAVYATRASTIKDGLRIVGGHQADTYQSERRKAHSAYQQNDMSRAGHHADNAFAAHSNTHNIANAVGGSRRISPSGGHYGKRDLELIGRDETHEYFARAIYDDEEGLYARGFEGDFYDDIYEY